MQVISSGKNTQLHAFPTLATEFTYPHVQDARLNIQSMPELKLFLAVNPQIGFELLRKSQKTGVDTISRVKKVLFNDLACGACSGKRRSEIALGSQDGTIQFYDVKKAAISAQRFRPENNRQGVLQMTYSRCDELLSCIYDNHEINIFGLTTSVKMDQYQLDMNSTVARFNPTKRFHMAVGSYMSTITVLDIQSKKSIFKQTKAHKETPCADLFWSPSDAQQLISVGYDCTLNVYDVRQKHLVHQIKHSSPYSCVAISECGTFCATGSLCGDLCSYDLRSIRSSLTTRKAVHSGTVSSVGFLPVDTTNSSGDQSESIDVARTSTADSMSANLLGGRRTMLYSSMQSKTLGNASQRSSVCRESLGIRGRPSMSAVTSGEQDENDAQNSFHGFLNKCTRMPEMFKSGRDSLMDMEVRPVRFADISDSSVASMGNMQNSPCESIPKRRSSVHNRMVSVIREDSDDYIDISPIRALPAKSLIPHNILKDHQHTTNLMMSSIGESSKSELHNDIKPVSLSPDNEKVDIEADMTALGYRLTELELKNQENSQLILQRLENIEESHEKRSQELLQRMHEFDVFCRLQLWNMEDTDMAMLHHGLSDVKSTVAQLARSDPFIEQFMALKEENTRLRAQLRAKSTVIDGTS